jgi:hypothetical protein
MNRLLKYILIPIFFCIYLTINGQIAENRFLIELGNKNIKTAEPFTIAVTLQNFDNTPVIKFPEIKGFQKRDQSTTRNYSSNSSTKTIATQIIKQNYYAEKAGQYVLAPFIININGQNIRSEGSTINVDATNDEEILSDNIFTENIAINDALLIVSTDKQRVFVGEGFNLRLSLIISENHTADWEFYMIETQLSKILKKLKPINCWEENFGIKDLRAVPIVVSGKKYIEYRIYQASFYPINTQNIEIPSVSLTMKVGTEEGIKRVAKFQNYSSKPLTVSVSVLPPHPLKNQIPVGNFRLEEAVSHQKIQTGKSFSYQFKITGDGNLSIAKVPSHDSSGVFDIYPPTVSFSTTFQNKGIVEEKTFDYTIIPKQNGEYTLKDRFYWVFFDPRKKQYDTLRSNIRLIVGGQDIDNTELSEAGSNLIYDGIEKLDSTKQEFDYQEIIKNIANVLVVLMLVGMVFIFKKK